MPYRLPRAAFAVAIATAAFASHAGTVTLTGWAHDRHGTVKMSHPAAESSFVRAHAGAFEGTVGGFGGADAAFNGALVTYCVELTQSAPAWGRATAGYEIVDGGVRFGDGDAADLGSFMTFLETRIDSGGGEAWRLAVAGQLAIWNFVYDDDATLASGAMREHDGKGGNASVSNPKPSYRDLADTLLAEWSSWRAGHESAYDVFVLRHDTKQDYLLLRERAAPPASLDVPEPGSLALAALALAGAGAARRRRLHRPA